MKIEKGKGEHINTIMNIIKDAINDMESKEIYQWDSIYPDEEVLTLDINKENIYVYVEENIIKGFIILNHDEAEEYKTLEWKYIKGKHLIVHRLCVSPKYQGKGIATRLMEYAENYGKNNKYESIRLDAFIKNRTACSLYENRGYEKVGIVTFRKGEFYCYEKNVI